jgi:hypothetical protein
MKIMRNSGFGIQGLKRGCLRAWRFVLQNTKTGILKPFARFFACESGMTLPLMAFSLVALTGFVGVAIDTGRMQMVQSKLQFSLDAAGLAAGSTISTTSLNSEVSKYLNANFNGYMGATVTGATVVANTANTVFTLSATASLPTTFMGTVGIKTITVTANSQVSRAVTGVELVMVLDNTGSMLNAAGGGVSKIAALKTAATAFVNNVFSAGTGNGNVWMGIVPFSQSVNIGTGHPTWLNATYDASISGMPISQGPGWGPSSSSWGGCVDAQPNGEDSTDDPPSSSNTNTLLNQYYWTSDNINYGTPFDNMPNKNSGINKWTFPAYNQCVTTYNRCKSGSCTNVSPTCSTSGGHTCTLISPTCTTTSSCTASSTTTCTLTGYTYASPLNTTQQGPNLNCPQQVTMMTNNSTSLLASINAMTAQGDTLINQGLVWGWRMLSPRWQGMWGGTMNANGLPLAYNTPGMAKVVVLMTDGYNTIDDNNRGAYWYIDNGLTGSTNGTTAVSNLDTKTLDVCNAMKAQGIYIYTIALGTDTDADSLALLQNCATAVNYYFNSPSTTTLNGIFGSIGDSLANLRVSK